MWRVGREVQKQFEEKKYHKGLVRSMRNGIRVRGLRRSDCRAG